jgi:UDP-N-acetylglucosamine--N-acetylmuramyl-(pentapeptide) pyrophosphoryl-undecaprenol N-acetylglucosamine transferase
MADDLQNRYEIYPTVDPAKMYSLLEKADIVLARSGANTVSEILITKRPSIFIPLPFAYNDEQTKNALYAKEFGIAEVIDQRNATPDNVYQTILDIKDGWKEMVRKVRDKESPDVGAAGNVVNLLKQYV